MTFKLGYSRSHKGPPEYGKESAGSYACAGLSAGFSETGLRAKTILRRVSMRGRN